MRMGEGGTNNVRSGIPYWLKRVPRRLVDKELGPPAPIRNRRLFETGAYL